jgi:thioredoxin-dependent peroxiredoxin
MKIALVQPKRRNKMESRTTLRKGDQAPGFSLPAFSGKTLKLGDFRGRKLLIYFFPKAGTSG